MDRREFLKETVGITASGLLLSNRSLEVELPEKPNLLFVFSDGHRARTLGCYGDEQIMSPNFDKFSSEGMQFNNCISPAPLCVPMRHINMTGKFSCNNGMYIGNKPPFANGKHELIGRTFKNAGYVCGYIGKWHMGYVNTDPGDPRRSGFDDYWRVTGDENGSGNHDYFEWTVWKGKDSQVAHSGFRPEGMVDFAEEFLTTNKDKPFCLYLSFGPPHGPLTPDAKNDHYHDYVPPANVAEEDIESATEKLAGYAGLIEGVDDAFGRLMGILKGLGLKRNTIVVYTSDHGNMQRSHGLNTKKKPYDESLRIPFLIRWPRRMRAGVKTDMPFSVVDFYPTLAGLAGLDVPAGLDGWDFSDHVLSRPGAKEQNEVYLSMRDSDIAENPGWRGVKTKQYTYVSTVDGPWLLFDDINDPWQMNNLVESEPALVAKYDGMTNNLMEKYGDHWRVI